jgi:hypothetical protein
VTIQRAARARRINAELQRLRVHVETLPSGAYRLRRGLCHLMTVDLNHLGDEDLAMFAGTPHRVEYRIGGARWL